jgi:molybdopterin-guanine dinucleotide biosynthesis protein A
MMSLDKNKGDRHLLNGLVLAGGKSVRMGRDKGLLRWHGKAQRYFLADLLAKYCHEVFISCRAEQVPAITAAGYKALPDSAEVDGQYGAILSAMAVHSDKAWLVVACDLPLMNDEALARLIAARDSRMLATAYRSAEDGLPEPLAAIWEPSACSMLQQKLSAGITCPRKALIQSAPNVKLIDPLEPTAIMNVNTPEAAKAARQHIKTKVVNYAS